MQTKCAESEQQGQGGDRAPNRTREAADVSSGEEKTLGSPTKEASGEAAGPLPRDSQKDKDVRVGKRKLQKPDPPPQATDRPRLRV